MKSQLTIPNTTVLTKVNKWTIELLPGEKEMCVTDGYTCCYAYYDKDMNTLRWDNLNVPSYVRKKALILARKSMESIYV